MSCLRNFCLWFLALRMCSGQMAVGSIPPEDVTDPVETATFDNIDAPQECGGVYTQENGRISSPGYLERNYSSNSNCTWSIKVDEGKVLVMNFEHMDVEIGPPDCPFDGVIVVDDSDLDPIPFTPGPNPFNALWTHPIPQVLDKFCGNEPFKPFVSVTNSVRIGFYSDSDTERSGFVLTWRTVDAKPTDGLCEGWQNVASGDKFDWKIFSGRTPSSGTGPHFDHTKQNEDGHYAYIESSSPQVANDVALLVSPESTFRDEDSDYCLDFWYHMHGSQMGSLGVGLLVGNTQERKWMKSGNQGNQWNHESITINRIELPFKVIFAGFVGQNHEGDIAIDDIILYGEPCSEISWEDRIPLLDEEIGAYTEPCVKEDEFHCKNASTCISRQKLCDSVVDCPEMDDEDSDNCKNATFISPPIEATSDPLVEETTEENIFGESATDDSTNSLDTTPDFADSTTTTGDEIDQEPTRARPRETTWFREPTASPVDTTLDIGTESTESPIEDTTVVLPRETTNFVKRATTTASGSANTDSDFTTLEDDVTITVDIDTTDDATSPIATDSDQDTTMSTTERNVIETKANGDKTSVSDWTTTAVSNTSVFVEARKEPPLVKLSTTVASTPSAMGRDVTTRSVLQPERGTSSETTETVIASSDDKSNPESGPAHNAVITSDELTSVANTHKVPHVFISTTPMVLLNKLKASTTSSITSSSPNTTTLNNVPVTLSAEVSGPKHHRSSTAKMRKDISKPHQSTTNVLRANIETTTRPHAVGNMEVPTMADKQKGGDGGSSVTSPISLCVMAIALFFSFINTV